VGAERRLRHRHARRWRGALCAPRWAARTFDTLEAPSCCSRGRSPRLRPPWRRRSAWVSRRTRSARRQVTAALLRALRRRAADSPPTSAACSRPRRGRPALLDSLGIGDRPAPRPQPPRRPVTPGSIPRRLFRRRASATLACAAGDWRAAFGQGGALADRPRRLRRAPRSVDLAGEVASLLESGGSDSSRPARAWARASPTFAGRHSRASCGARVTVSTKTKACSASSPNASWPLVASCLPAGFRWTLLMGRENYLCRRRPRRGRRGTGAACPSATVFWRSPGCRAAPGAARSTSRRCLTARPDLPALRRDRPRVARCGGACLGGRCGARADCHWRRLAPRARALIWCV